MQFRLLLALLAGLWVSGAATAQEYRFDRFWPLLPQPWYFNGADVVVYDDNFLATTFGNAIGVFDKTGRLVNSVNDFGVLLRNGPEGEVFFFDVFERAIRRLSRDGETSLFAATTTVDPADRPSVFEADYHIDGQGLHHLLIQTNIGSPITTAVTFRVEVFDANGELLRVTPLAGEHDFAIDFTVVDGSYLLLAGSQGEVLVFDAQGNVAPSSWETTLANLGNPALSTLHHDAGGTEVFFFSSGFQVTGTMIRTQTDGTLIDTTLLPVNPGPVNVPREFRAGGMSHPIDGQRFVYDAATLAVWRLNAAGEFDSFFGGIQRFDDTGRMFGPFDVAVADDGTVLVADRGNRRVQSYDENGNFIRSFGTEPYPDSSPARCIARDVQSVATYQNRVYVGGIDPCGGICVYSTRGNTLATIDYTAETGQCGIIESIDISDDGKLYATTSRRQIVKVDASSFAVEDVFDENSIGAPFDVRIFFAVGARPGGNIFIQASEIDSSGATVNRGLLEIDSSGAYQGFIEAPAAGQNMAFPDPDHVLLTGAWFVERLNLNTGQVETVAGDSNDLDGIAAGRFRNIQGLDVASSGALYVADSRLGRVQKFRPDQTPVNARVIVVSAGGPYPGNVLWPATQLNANFAVRSLNFQGFDKETTQYLSSDLDLDLDQNGLADDVDLDASNDNLRQSILGPGGQGLDGFAGDPALQELVIYLVDHGGENKFRMSATETLSASELDGWLDSWQAVHPGAQVRIIYDACQSGSFMQTLSGPNRTIITSAAGSENAYFLSQGALSFSSFFWTHIFNGLDLRDAFKLAEQSTRETFDGQQNPLIDADGDGIVNEPIDDIEALANVFVGNGTDTFSTRPLIGAISVTPATIADGSTATLSALDVTDADGINRVWAVLRPPGFNPGSPDNPVADLPTVDLLPVGGGAYEVAYNAFTATGTYQITINAQDIFGNTAVPRVTTVTVQNPLKRRAVVIVGGVSTDENFSAFQRNGQLAVAALQQQGYGPDGTDCSNALCDDIKFYVDSGLADADGTAVLSNVQFAIEQWGADENLDGNPDVQDLTIYLVGQPEGGGYRLAGGEVLTPSLLDGYLATAEALIPGRLTLVIDGDDAGGIIRQLTPRPQRVTVASTSVSQSAGFFDSGAVSFSQFFWSLTSNGATVTQAFRVARSAIRFSPAAQTPEIDDSGNGLPNELQDGLLSNGYAIGTGVLLAGDDPVIGAIEGPPVAIDGSATFTVTGVTSTSAISRVVLIAVRDSGGVEEVVMIDQGGDVYQAQVTGLWEEGVAVAAYAEDQEGDVSLPALAATRPDLIFEGGFE